MTILDRPPAGWKRRGFTEKVKLQVILAQDGRCKATGERLGTVENTRFDHRPPLFERQFDTEAWDTVPPENDIAFIEAISVKEHDIRTNGPGGEKRITTAGSDQHRKAKAARLAKKQAPPAVGLKPEREEKRGPKAKIASRPFQTRKGKQPWQSGSTKHSNAS